jgi:hypothetical protein
MQKRTLTVRFGRAVTADVPNTMVVTVTPLATASDLLSNVTFVGGPQTRTVLLANEVNVVSFSLVPSTAAGLTEPMPYRIAWRERTGGRQETHDFLMPDHDVEFADLGGGGGLSGGGGYSPVVPDNEFTILNAQDDTRRARFSAASIATGRTRTYSLPNADTTLVGTDASQTLTGKQISGSFNTLTNVPQSAVTGLPAALSAREPSIGAGTTGQYWRGDKTFQTLNQDAVPDGAANKAYTATERAKLAGIATGATANSADAALLARANHTGTQAASTIQDFSTAADARVAAGISARLGNVDNTTDANKPVSAATQAALNAKENAVAAGTVSQYYRGDKTFQTLNADAVPDGTTNKAFLDVERTKLAGIAAAATANSPDAVLLSRANHTGTQPASTIQDFSSAADARVAAGITGKQDTSARGQANGYASLDSGGKVPVNQLPSSIMEYQGTWNASTNTPTLANGTGGTGDVYRVSVPGAALGFTFDVGDYVIYNGSAWEKSDTTDAVATVAGRTGNVTLTKSDVGLGNVDDTSDSARNSAAAALTNKDLTSATNTFPTLNQDTTGNAATAGAALTANNVTGTVVVANGGTGLTTLAAKNVLLGNGTDPLLGVAPGNPGNVLTSDGTTWTSAAFIGGGTGGTGGGTTAGAVDGGTASDPGSVSLDGGTADSTGTAALTRVQFRRSPAVTWTYINPVLASGEVGFESDTSKFKIGNGSTAWTSLAYAGGSSGGSETLSPFLLMGS